MMKKNYKLPLVILAVAVGAGLIIGMTSSDGYTIPVPNSLQPAGTDGVAITCNLAQITTVYDNFNNNIATLKSTFQSGSPEFLGLVSPSGKDIKRFNIEPKIFCTNAGTEKYNIVVDASRLQARVISERLDNVKLITEIENFDTKKLTFKSGDGEKSLGSVNIFATNIDDKLESTTGAYDSFQEFRIIGDLVLYFEFAPSLKYTIPIEQNDIRTWYKLEVEGKSNPSPPPTQPPPTPTNQEICEDDGGEWIPVSLGSGSGVCKRGSDGTLQPFDAELVINLDVLYRDNKKQRQLIDNDFSATFNPATLIGSLDNNDRTLSRITFTPFIKTDRQTSYDSGEVSVIPVLRVAGQDIALQERLLAGAPKTASQVQYGVFQGLSLGEASISSAEIHSAISTDLIPEGQRRDVKLTVELAGDVTVKKSGGTLKAEISDVLIQWDSLELTREKKPLTGGGSSGTLNCEQGGKVLAEIDGVETCIDKGDGGNDGGQVGDDGIEICIDSQNSGGFPCDEQYRNQFCNGGTNCSVPPTKTSSEEECPDDGLQSASLADVCLTIPADDDGTPSSPPTCTNCDGNNSLSNDSLLLIGGVFAVIGILAYAIKRRG